MKNIQEIIDKIVDADKKSQDVIVKAEQYKIEFDKKISENAEKKRTEYLARARQNIKILEQSEKNNANLRLHEIEEKYKNIFSETNKKIEGNKKFWVKLMIKKIVEE